jgi:hypothetical protein
MIIINQSMSTKIFSKQPKLKASSVPSIPSTVTVESPKSKAPEAKVDWTDSNKRIFITAMMNASIDNFVDSGFKKATWLVILKEFNLKSGLAYSKQQLQSQHGVLKKKYTIYKGIMDNSGFGINPETLGPSAPADVWERYIEAHPAAAAYQNKALLYFEDLESVFTGKVATGKYAMSSVTPTGGEKKRYRDIQSDEEENMENEKLSDKDEGNEGSEDELPRDAQKGLKKEVRPYVRVSKVKAADEVTNLLTRICKNQEKDTPLVEALKLFTATSAKDLTVLQKLRFKNALAITPSKADVFLSLDEDEREEFIRAESCL